MATTMDAVQVTIGIDYPHLTGPGSQYELSDQEFH